MMSADERRTQLMALPFLNALPKSLATRYVDHLEDAGVHTQLDDGVELFSEGDHSPNYGYVLLKGSVSVKKSYADDAQASAPALLGEIKQFNPNSERTATVCASGSLEVLRFRWVELTATLEAALSEAECELLRKALLDYAWDHVLS